MGRAETIKTPQGRRSPPGISPQLIDFAVRSGVWLSEIRQISATLQPDRPGTCREHADASRRCSMTTFDEREKSYEKKFAMDQELRFKAEARRNKLLGE
jgi:hypothetical protein